MKLTVGSCFSSIGGLELGLEWTGGFETKWQIENDEYASAVLKKHWPDVKRYSDIRDVANPEPVDVICGGFPCQDVSLAGSRAGLEGKRSTLWGEMFRLVCEIRPRWVVAENVPGLLSSDAGRFFGNILRDLAGAGYDAEWGVLSAAGVGAPHLRRRVFILAYAQRSERWPFSEGWNDPDRGYARREEAASGAGKCGQNVADANSLRCRPRRAERGSRQGRSQIGGGGILRNATGQRFPNGSEGTISSTRKKSQFERSNWWTIEPNVGRMAHGISKRVDRLKCLGNAVVPQVAQKIGEMILNNQSSRGRWK